MRAGIYSVPVYLYCFVKLSLEFVFSFQRKGKERGAPIIKNTKVLRWKYSFKNIIIYSNYRHCSQTVLLNWEAHSAPIFRSLYITGSISSALFHVAAGNPTTCRCVRTLNLSEKDLLLSKKVGSLCSNLQHGERDYVKPHCSEGWVQFLLVKCSTPTIHRPLSLSLLPAPWRKQLLWAAQSISQTGPNHPAVWASVCHSWTVPPPTPNRVTNREIYLYSWGILWQVAVLSHHVLPPIISSHQLLPISRDATGHCAPISRTLLGLSIISCLTKSYF